MATAVFVSVGTHIFLDKTLLQLLINLFEAQVILEAKQMHQYVHFILPASCNCHMFLFYLIILLFSICF